MSGPGIEPGTSVCETETLAITPSERTKSFLFTAHVTVPSELLKRSTINYLQLMDVTPFMNRNITFCP